MIDKLSAIPKLFEEFFDFIKEKEKNRNVIYYQKQIKRLRKLKGYAQDFIEVDELIENEKDRKKLSKLKRLKEKYKIKFRDLD